MRVVIVGGGISGLLSAYRLLHSGASVVVYERRATRVPRKHCTGIVSKETLERIPFASKHMLQKYNSIFFYINGYTPFLELYSSGYFAYRINRVEHEEKLQEVLLSRGVDIRFGHEVVSLVKKQSGWVATIRDWLRKDLYRDEPFNFAVIAEGFPGQIAKRVGCNSTSIPLIGLQKDYRIKGLIDEHTLYIYINPRVFGLGFAWLAPIDTYKTTIGVATSLSTSPVLVLEQYATKFFQRALKVGILGEESQLYGGIVLMGYPKKVIGVDVVCLGDAVSMVKSISGGGLYAISYFSQMLPQIVIKHDNATMDRTAKLLNQLKRQYYLKVFLWQGIHNFGYILNNIIRRHSTRIRLRSSSYFDEHEKLLPTLIIEILKSALKGEAILSKSP
ncbi:MAG: NAD(P)/FAD-dependent oxidoreductase [Ignisphaera sp.]|nr:NAD(P)/FAD-dependent oxidoreductase [Ignisphaera sp.]